MYVMKCPFHKPSDIIYSFYPQLRAVEELKTGDEAEYYDVLLLGASTLNRKWGNIEALLWRRLHDKLNRKIRTFNLAAPALTSRDSLTMFTRLKKRKFDLILWYNNINDLRANNIPPEMFKIDYSMFSFYRDINLILSHYEIDFLTLPYALHKIGSSLGDMFTHSIVPTYHPQRKWIRYGAKIKTQKSFEKNLRGVLDAASEQGTPVILMSFASYVPEDYNRSQFEGKRLDFGRHCSPVEDWGYPPYVIRGIRVHNKVIGEISGQYNNVIFVDQEKLMPKSDLYFGDICHLTRKGC